MRAGARGEGLQLAQVLPVQRVGAADGHRDAVQRHRVALGDLVEDPQRAAPGVHEVLRQDLEPVDGRAPGEDVAEVDRAQADADAEVGEIPAIHGR